MSEKLALFNEKAQNWDKNALLAKEKSPIKELKTLPKMDGVSKNTAKHLRLKALKYMLKHDESGGIKKGFFTHPLRYGFNYLKSLNKEAFKRDGDFFLYNLDTLASFQKKLGNEKSILLVGFSYCHKPFECPAGRFSENCIADKNHPVCQQCFVGKCMDLMPSRQVEPVIIPTVHYIGEKVFSTVHKHPDKEILFIITACELTLKMFADWGNMVKICGIGVRLDGRICNTMQAFELSERGIKPGLTCVLPQTQERILDLLKLRHISSDSASASASSTTS